MSLKILKSNQVTHHDEEIIYFVQEIESWLLVEPVIITNSEFMQQTVCNVRINNWFGMIFNPFNYKCSIEWLQSNKDLLKQPKHEHKFIYFNRGSANIGLIWDNVYTFRSYKLTEAICSSRNIKIIIGQVKNLPSIFCDMLLKQIQMNSVEQNMNHVAKLFQTLFLHCPRETMKPFVSQHMMIHFCKFLEYTEVKNLITNIISTRYFSYFTTEQQVFIWDYIKKINFFKILADIMLYCQFYKKAQELNNLTKLAFLGSFPNQNKNLRDNTPLHVIPPLLHSQDQIYEEMMGFTTDIDRIKIEITNTTIREKLKNEYFYKSGFHNTVSLLVNLKTASKEQKGSTSAQNSGIKLKSFAKFLNKKKIVEDDVDIVSFNASFKESFAPLPQTYLLQSTNSLSDVKKNLNNDYNGSQSKLLPLFQLSSNKEFGFQPNQFFLRRGSLLSDRQQSYQNTSQRNLFVNQSNKSLGPKSFLKAENSEVYPDSFKDDSFQQIERIQKEQMKNIEYYEEVDYYSLQIMEIINIVIENILNENYDFLNIEKKWECKKLIEALFFNNCEIYQQILRNYLFKIKLNLKNPLNSSHLSGQSVNLILQNLYKSKSLEPYADQINQISLQHFSFIQQTMIEITQVEDITKNNQIKIQGLIIDKKCGSIRLQLTQTLLQIIDNQENKDKLIQKIQINCWDALFTWFFDYKINTIYQNLFIKLIKLLFTQEDKLVAKIFFKLNIIGRLNLAFNKIYQNFIYLTQIQSEQYQISLKEIIKLVYFSQNQVLIAGFHQTLIWNVNVKDIMKQNLIIKSEKQIQIPKENNTSIKQNSNKIIRVKTKQGNLTSR